MSLYTLGLFKVHLLQEAGFRFDNESFGLQFWFDLALLKQTILKGSLPEVSERKRR